MVPFLPMIFKRVDKIVVARFACALFAVCGILICVLGPDFLRNNLGVLYLLTAVQTLGYTMTMFACSAAAGSGGSGPVSYRSGWAVLSQLPITSSQSWSTLWYPV